MSAVETGASKLADAADKYHDAVKRFEEAEEEFEREMAKGRLAADSQMPGGKLPSQDRRQDLALTALHREQPEVYVEFFAAKAHKEAVAVKYRALAASVSARQSLLKAAGP
jgi:uncharacterized protein YigA (DUF484 family)